MTTIAKAVFKGVFVTLIALLSTFTTYAQDASAGKVWTKISTYTSLGIESKNGKVSSSNASIDQLFRNLQISKIEKAFPSSRSVELSKVYEITCSCDENVLLQEIAKFSTVFERPEIAPKYEALDVPNDYNTVFLNDYALNLINASGAWDITTGDSSVTIAICDANYHYAHEELVGKYSVVSQNWSTDYNHGTAVAVTAAGKTNNATGKSSIGYNTSLQLRSMDYNELLSATYSGAKIINVSWTSGCSYSSFAQDLINEVYNNGSVIVAAAGNGSTCNGANNLVYPASFDHVISVTSVGPFDNHERYVGNPLSTHQHNFLVDISAPGYDVALTTSPGNYLTGNGTSFAAPYVSGTIGLMLAVNPCLTPANIEDILKATAVNIYAQNPNYIGKLGAGRLDARAAVEMASTFSTFPVDAQVTIDCSTNERSIDLNLDNSVSTYQIQWNNGSTAETLSGLQSGYYQAIIRDNNMCVGTFETSFDSLEFISIEGDLQPATCYNDNSGFIEVSVNGGFGEYTYNWSNGKQTPNIYYLQSGDYSLTVTDENGCQKSEYFHIDQPDAILVNLATENVDGLNAGSINMEIDGGVAPFIFSWSNGQTTEDISGLTAGFYEVGIVDANGCEASANAFVNTEEITYVDASYSEELSKYEEEETSNLPTGETSGQILELTENAENTSIIMYPNPTSESATIKWGTRKVEKIAVYNLLGQLIQNEKVNEASQQFELTSLPSGEYTVSVIDASGIVSNQKLTVIR